MGVMKRNFALFLAVAIALLAVLPGAAMAAYRWESATLEQCHAIYQCEDMFYNYDFETEDAVWNNVDWTTNMLFRENADRAKVHYLYFGEWIPASVMYMYLDDGWLAYYESDTGTKQPWALPALHLRVYGAWDPQGWYEYPEFWLWRNYNDAWGYYVVGTTHLDYWEWLGGWSGYSEDAEADFAQRARDKGKYVEEDCVWWDNYEPARWEPPGGDDHRWQNDGATTFVWV